MKFVRFLGATALCSILLFGGIFLSITCKPKGVFHSNYMNVINDKFDRLMQINDPKIIIIGGSNCAFGIDQDLIERETGYPVVNMGLHAGFGHVFYTELAKQNIRPGDIVVLAYEYNWMDEDAFTNIGSDLVMSGIDDNISMYRYLPLDKYPSILGYLFTYAGQKRTAEAADGLYSREAFDPVTTQMMVDIDETYDFSPEKNGIFTMAAEISEPSRKYLTDLKDYVQSKGAQIYFVAPPLSRDSIYCDLSEFDKLKELEEQEIGIPFISNPSDYFFDGSLLYDTKYHCNKKGMEKRTQMLIDDLKKQIDF